MRAILCLILLIKQSNENEWVPWDRNFYEIITVFHLNNKSYLTFICLLIAYRENICTKLLIYLYATYHHSLCRLLLFDSIFSRKNKCFPFPYTHFHSTCSKTRVGHDKYVKDEALLIKITRTHAINLLHANDVYCLWRIKVIYEKILSSFCVEMIIIEIY